MGEHYRKRSVFGFTIIDEFKVVKHWKPQEWNNFCFLRHDNQYNLRLNDEEILTGILQSPSLREISSVVLMHKPTSETFYGAVADLQIWSRLLTELEISEFNSCKVRPVGNVYEWNPSELTIHGDLDIEEIPREELCPQAQKSIIVANGNLMGFFQAVEFCGDVLQGRVAVGKDPETIQDMGRENSGEECPDFFYSGHVADENGHFVGFHDRHPLELRQVEIQNVKDAMIAYNFS